jgi:D-alanyl-D-alanine carboxypeptidase/D-alanyl-D-alanine-endopeptidase (penicillin-binding protein 4)
VNRGFESFPDSPDSEASPQAADDPPAHAASLMVSLLEERGVEVQGQATKGLEPTGATEIASVDSPPMRDIVRQMMSDSDNTGAEMLLKELGLHRLGQGTTEGGAQALTEILGEMGMPLEGVVIRDGSGLHDENRVTCQLLVALLEETGPDSQLADTMAVAGETGTLRECHVGTPATGKVRAKSGRLREASALSGFIETVAGQELTFAYVTNGDSVDQSTCPAAREALIESLVIFPEGPPASDLEPLLPTEGS